MSLTPHNTLAWCRLGRNYEDNNELEKAVDAWLNCCLNGDPGHQGCFGAGRMMEQLGNLPRAIVYYRLSRLEGMLKPAQELEASLESLTCALLLVVFAQVFGQLVWVPTKS